MSWNKGRLRVLISGLVVLNEYMPVQVGVDSGEERKELNHRSSSCVFIFDTASVCVSSHPVKLTNTANGAVESSRAVRAFFVSVASLCAACGVLLMSLFLKMVASVVEWWTESTKKF